MSSVQRPLARLCLVRRLVASHCQVLQGLARLCPNRVRHVLPKSPIRCRTNLSRRRPCASPLPRSPVLKTGKPEVSLSITVYYSFTDFEQWMPYGRFATTRGTLNRSCLGRLSVVWLGRSHMRSCRTRNWITTSAFKVLPSMPFVRLLRAWLSLISLVRSLL